ncbi:hypothetical protein [Streptomyces sp. NPDC096311]|uniref:hypothetical protein n=1 Tax=Streptomyces sp. NPDC096311 TaxID=3366083 RepID=UPI003807CAE7
MTTSPATEPDAVPVDVVLPCLRAAAFAGCAGPALLAVDVTGRDTYFDPAGDDDFVALGLAAAVPPGRFAAGAARLEAGVCR